MERDGRRRRERHREADERRAAASAVSLSSSSMAIKLWKCYQSRVSSGGRPDDDFVFDDIFEMIDADLQPVKPDLKCSDSIRVFENHKKLTKDYLKLQTEVTLLSTKKKQLEERLNRTAAGRDNRDTAKYVSELVQLQDENESLRKLHKTLMAERVALTRPPQQPPLTDDWVLSD
ncbi:uncharacterized protein LOC119103664 [Pollicipes pollicipes]|uniref:uncharacterized protein LOC119103664 n=1 Tax=Pollicipes pollicipes TaxID=41117 RepID=UPI001884BFAB|nr:uncharacterized protein LOC119103664 [Pollicipes pollicipes]